MRTSDIHFEVELDKDNIPEKIRWNATDNPTGKQEETKAISLALWDGEDKSTLKIDLWVKDMPVDEMKVFYLEAIRGIAASLKNATGDELMFDKLTKTCNELFEHVREENK